MCRGSWLLDILLFKQKTAYEMRISDWSSDVCSSDLRMYDLYPGQRATGEVLLEGRNVIDPKTDVNLLRAQIGVVFQKPTPFPMSIYDNIAFGIRLYEKVSKADMNRSEEHTSELQSLIRISYAVFCLKKKKKQILQHKNKTTQHHR